MRQTARFVSPHREVLHSPLSDQWEWSWCRGRQVRGAVCLLKRLHHPVSGNERIEYLAATDTAPDLTMDVRIK